MATGTPTMTGAEAWATLQEGNMRYVSGKAIHPNQTIERRKEVVSGQHPFATVLTCADSRVPPELLFDQGIGDLFVVRTAGAIADQGPVLGSIEYAAEHLGVPLLVVLGHQSCGAVQATLQAASSGGTLPGHLGSISDTIMPAVQAAQGRPGDPLDNTVRANVLEQVKLLSTSEPVLAKLVASGKLLIVGAYYSFQSGSVEKVESVG